MIFWLGVLTGFIVATVTLFVLLRFGAEEEGR